ncbi:MAG: barstar family protein [Eubacteriales bacterium]|nr:barstar family protein [Eubacteriales bacterium]
MKKVILDFNVPESKDKVIEYINEKLELPEYYTKSMDALYDYLTELSEPTAVGFFMPTPEYEEIDLDYFMYIEEVRQTFIDAEKDGDNLAVIFGDLPDNYDIDDDFDDLYSDDEWDDSADYEDEDDYSDDDYNDIDLFGAFK